MVLACCSSSSCSGPLLMAAAATAINLICFGDTQLGYHREARTFGGYRTQWAHYNGFNCSIKIANTLGRLCAWLSYR
ncbi:hypothetical protein CYLTODRAFT_424926 [Cylindrobasidium torrendii FP15055 ss-10]|uniref:Uncharacterized protein n=1 Tax=Cylindrobasidium torrendii FP15055 ss-10 TaxID=1314674 RepID=A0A0D7B2F7_9AGAR|nr:hypothetical protein CYLTODRAFT_424926 [Cylindrobasidium torrendii FP15055 ss-10]